MNLTLGDYLWVQDSTEEADKRVFDLIIERKTIEDLSMSISDGRYKEQKNRLRSCGVGNVVYLIEGGAYGQGKSLKQFLS